MDTYSARVAGVIYGGAAAEAAALEPEGTEFSTGTQLSLYVADGLLEVLEFASDGQGADPAATSWLALLRWYKNRYGAFPEGQPTPRTRWLDAHALYPGDVEAETKAGLEQPEMGLPRNPYGQDAHGTDALVRAAPYGLLPQVEADAVVKMSHQGAVLTHGAATGWHTSVAYSLLIHHVIAGKTLLGALTEVLGWLADKDDDLAELLRRSLGGDITPPTTPDEVLAAAIRCVADAVEQPVAPEQLYAAAVTAAVNYGGNTHATALVTGQLIGGLLGNTATRSPTHLDNYLVLEELIDRWLKLTT